MNPRLRAFKNAFNGWIFFFRDGLHPKIHIWTALLATILGIFLNMKRLEWAVMILAIVAVVALEMINSAIEKLCDLLHPDEHPSIKFVKDVAAGAVLVAAIAAAVIGLIIFVPKLATLFV